MKTSLKNVVDEDGKVEAPPVADAEALANIDGDYELAESSSVTLALGSIAGSVDSRDLIIPRLNIVQNVGPLSQEFDGGDLVFNKETVLATVEQPIYLTVLSVDKTYEERLPYDPNGPRPTVYKSIEEVVEAGHWVDWRNNQPPPVREVATILVLIEKPEGVDGLGFSHELLDKEYALALWTLRGTGYTRGAKKILSASQLELQKTGLLSGLWELSTERAQVNGNWVFAPVIRLKGKNSPELIEQIKERLS
jgi:hypothetical protein